MAAHIVRERESASLTYYLSTHWNIETKHHRGTHIVFIYTQISHANVDTKLTFLLPPVCACLCVRSVSVALIDFVCARSLLMKRLVSVAVVE